MLLVVLRESIDCARRGGWRLNDIVCVRHVSTSVTSWLLRASRALHCSRYCFACVCSCVSLCVCVSVQKPKNYSAEIDVTVYEYLYFFLKLISMFISLLYLALSLCSTFL